MKKTSINIKVELDENNIPDKIYWDATDGGVKNQKVEAFILSLWDKEKSDTMRLDLWTKDMEVEDMKKFFHQTFVSMANSYKRATNDENMANEILDFSEYFAVKTKIKKQK